MGLRCFFLFFYLYYYLFSIKQLGVVRVGFKKKKKKRQKLLYYSGIFLFLKVLNGRLSNKIVNNRFNDWQYVGQEPHLSVHQSNVFYLLGGLLILCVCTAWKHFHCSTFLCHIYLDNTCIAPEHVWEWEQWRFLYGPETAIASHTVRSVCRLCHCVACTKPVWECIHVWESLTFIFIFSSSLHIGFCVCSFLFVLFLVF